MNNKSSFIKEMSELKAYELQKIYGIEFYLI